MGHTNMVANDFTMISPNFSVILGHERCERCAGSVGDHIAMNYYY
jgi:hypothetical protein